MGLNDSTNEELSFMVSANLAAIQTARESSTAIRYATDPDHIIFYRAFTKGAAFTAYSLIQASAIFGIPKDFFMAIPDMRNLDSNGYPTHFFCRSMSKPVPYTKLLDTSNATIAKYFPASIPNVLLSTCHDLLMGDRYAAQRASLRRIIRQSAILQDSLISESTKAAIDVSSENCSSTMISEIHALAYRYDFCTQFLTFGGERVGRLKAGAKIGKELSWVSRVAERMMQYTEAENSASHTQRSMDVSTLYKVICIANSYNLAYAFNAPGWEKTFDVSSLHLSEEETALCFDMLHSDPYTLNSVVKNAERLSVQVLSQSMSDLKKG